MDSYASSDTKFIEVKEYVAKQFIVKVVEALGL